jgi:aspartate 1-decarboxylase
MQVFLLKSKIHRATVTGGNVKYEGSLTIAADLMEKCGMQEYEKILCGNMANGERFETYAIKGKRGAGQIILNGAVSHLGKKGDLLTIMSYAAASKTQAKGWKPRVVVLGKDNRVVAVKRGV